MLAEWPTRPMRSEGQSAPVPSTDWPELLDELCRVGADRPIPEILAAIVDLSVSALSADASSLGLWDPERGEVVIQAFADRRRRPEGAHFAAGQGVAGWVASTRRPVVIGDATRDQRYVSLEYPRTNSVLSVPLIWNDELVGTLTLTSSRVDAFGDADLRVLRLFATQAASLVVAARRIADDGVRAACLQLAIDLIQDGIVVCDRNFELLAVNRVAADRLGLPDERVEATSAWTELRGALQPALERAIHQEVTTDAVPFRTAAGTIVERGARVSPLLGPDGRALGAVAILDQPDAAAAMRWNRNLEDLAHDLKSPIGSIRGLLTLVLMEASGPLTEGQRDLLEHAQMASERLRATVDRLVGGGAQSDGDGRPALQPTALSEVAGAVLARLAGVAATRGVALEQHLPADLPRVQADPFQLARVLENLLDNAIKFSDAGGVVRLAVRIDGDHVECAVRDDGVGIPEASLERVFERHYQVPSANPLQAGSGLGLAICRRIVEQHGGRIWVESAEGRGTTVRFTLPIAT